MARPPKIRPVTYGKFVAEEVATVRATRTRQSDIVEHGLVVAPELAPP